MKKEWLVFPVFNLRFEEDSIESFHLDSLSSYSVGGKWSISETQLRKRWKWNGGWWRVHIEYLRRVRDDTHSEVWVIPSFCQLSILVKALQQFLIRLQPFHATPNQSNHLKWCIQSDDSCTPFYQYEWSSCFLWCNHCTWREGCSENPLDSPIASDHAHSERPSHRIRKGRCCRGGKIAYYPEICYQSNGYPRRCPEQVNSAFLFDLPQNVKTHLGDSARSIPPLHFETLDEASSAFICACIASRFIRMNRMR